MELKTVDPVASLDGLEALFQADVRAINRLLAPMGARLLPTAMHPWMDPHTEMRLWPHESNPIYEAFDRLFSCKGHGWANLQSTHVNLPFANDEEFARLHAAIRLVLPLLPALAASSPVMDGRVADAADARLEVYRTNSKRIPSIAGRVIPEPVFTRRDYETGILERIYNDLAPFDADGILRHEWANARGGIARFMRGSIEIRLLDIQECPLADCAMVALVGAAVRACAEERWLDGARQRAVEVEPLHAVLLDTIREAERAVIREPAILRALGLGGDAMTAGEVWRSLQESLLPDHPAWTPTLRRMLDAGTLSARILRRLPASPTRDHLRSVYAELARCLEEGRLFDA